jgi:hypothetical protein
MSWVTIDICPSQVTASSANPPSGWRSLASVDVQQPPFVGADQRPDLQFGRLGHLPVRRGSAGSHPIARSQPLRSVPFRRMIGSQRQSSPPGMGGLCSERVD